jgi:hypothetical protein
VTRLRSAIYHRLRVPVSMHYRLVDRLAPRRHTHVGRLPSPIDPYLVRWVRPSQIERISGRLRPRYGGPIGIGSVVDGDWDQTEPEWPAGDAVASLVCARRFQDTVHHRSIVTRVCEHVPWDRTEFIERISEIAKREPVNWPNYESPTSILETCQRLDALVVEIRESGMKTQREVRIRERSRVSIPELSRHEIIVDIARDNELLFFEGRHRLSIAIALGIEFIPVVIGARHPLSEEVQQALGA